MSNRCAQGVHVGFLYCAESWLSRAFLLCLDSCCSGVEARIRQSEAEAPLTNADRIRNAISNNEYANFTVNETCTGRFCRKIVNRASGGRVKVRLAIDTVTQRSLHMVRDSTQLTVALHMNLDCIKAIYLMDLLRRLYLNTRFPFKLGNG